LYNKFKKYISAIYITDKRNANISYDVLEVRNGIGWNFHSMNKVNNLQYNFWEGIQCTVIIFLRFKNE